MLLLDVSASMRREGLWPALQARARAYLDQTAPADRAGHPGVRRIGALAAQLRAVGGAAAVEAGGGRRRPAGGAGAGLGRDRPGGGAGGRGRGGGRRPRRAAGASQAETVVLVGDLAEGARLGALGPAEWPAGLRLRVERLEPATAGDNLGLQLVPSATDGAPAAAANRSDVRNACGSAAISGSIRRTGRPGGRGRGWPGRTAPAARSRWCCPRARRRCWRRRRGRPDRRRWCWRGTRSTSTTAWRSRRRRPPPAASSMWATTTRRTRPPRCISSAGPSR